MGTDSTLLYAYLPLRDFFASVQALEKGEGLSLELINLQHAVPERDYLYGLGLLREAFAQYEASVGIGPEMSKRAMPFFRENSRQLVGPEVGMYILPLFGNPDLALEGDGPMVRLAFDYGQLADWPIIACRRIFSCSAGNTIVPFAWIISLTSWGVSMIRSSLMRRIRASRPIPVSSPSCVTLAWRWPIRKRAVATSGGLSPSVVRRRSSIVVPDR